MPFMFKFDTNIYIYIYIYINFKCVIVSWSSVTGSHYSTEFSVQNGGSKSHVMGTTVAMKLSIEFHLLGFYTLWLHTVSRKHVFNPETVVKRRVPV